MQVDEAKTKFIVKMNGYQYIRYKKYQNKKSKIYNKIFLNNLKIFVYNIRYFIIALLVYLMGRILIDIIFPVKYIPTDYGFFTIQGIVVPYIMAYILIFMVGLAWIIHGFGFIIVRR